MMVDDHLITVCRVCNRAIYQWHDIPLFKSGLPTPSHWTHFRFPLDGHGAVPRPGLLDRLLAGLEGLTTQEYD